VEAVEQPHGARPVAVRRWRRVVGIVDVWRVDDEWSRDEISRRYCSLDLETGERVTVFQDLQGWGWYWQRG